MKKKYTILLVDDDVIVRKTLGDILKQEGYNIILAESGESAIKVLTERLKTDSIELVITDLIMHKVDGMGVLTETKKLSTETMVIILTSCESISSAIDAVRLHADDYILKPKPSELKDLLFRVKRCLERYEFQRKVNFYENILPVCCVCKSIRDDSVKENGKGKWMNSDLYMQKKTNVEISHTYCDKCYKEWKEKMDASGALDEGKGES